LSFARASSAGSATELAATTPDNKVKLATRPMMDRLINGAIDREKTNLKICFLKLPST
jgi:hypothetical protein